MSSLRVWPKTRRKRTHMCLANRRYSSQKLFEHLAPACVILPATVPVPGLCMGLCLGYLE